MLLFLGMVMGVVIWFMLGVLAITIFEQVFDKEIYDNKLQRHILIMESREMWWLRLLIVLSGLIGCILSVLLYLIKALIEVIRGY